MEHDIARDLRVEKWRQIVLEANNSDIPKIQYIREHNLKENSFYYWQRFFRRQTAADGTVLPPARTSEHGISQTAAQGNLASSFIEVTAPSDPSEKACVRMPSSAEPAWKIMLRHGDYSIYVDNDVSEECLETVLRAVSHA